MRKLSRKVLSGLLVFTLGVTSSGLTAFANNENELDWEATNQLVTKNDKFTPVKDETIDEDEVVRALIVFDGDSAIEKGYDVETLLSNYWAKRYTQKLENAQDKVIDAINDEVLDGDEMNVRYRYTTISNAVSTELTYGEVLAIREVEGVEDVYVLPQHATEADDVNTSTSGDMVGSYLTWESGYTGAGMRVAIIDTGLDTDHPSFDADAYLYALNEQAEKDGKEITDYDLLDAAEIAEVLGNLSVSNVPAEYLYINEKIPFAFNYVDGGLDVTHDNDKQGDHGSHVAGIATANKYVPTADGYATQENGVVGIAPNAQVIVMKVFGKNGGAYTDDYMTAIQDAILLGADSINLSLGSGNPGESKEYTAAQQYINTIFDSLNGTDTVVSISAGNSGMWADYSFGGLLPEDVNMATNGSPGSYTNAFTVASADNTGLTGVGFEVAGSLMIYTESTDYGNKPFKTLDTNGNGTDLEYVFIDGIGVEEDFEGVDVAGKIVFVSRGETSFFEKYNIAAAKGASAVVIYNNTDGTIGLNLTGIEYNIPCVSILQSEGLAIKANSTQVSEKVYTGTLKAYSKALTIRNYNENAGMSDFSSWGVPGSLQLKPEIAAPGGNIWSTTNNGTYGLMSGTSMASPSVAGMSALVIEYIEAKGLAEETGLTSRQLAMSLLMSTAVPLTQEDTYYSPRKQGAGLANVLAATSTPVYVVMREDGKVKAELGDDPERTGKYTIGFTLVNLSDETQYYTVDTTTLTEEFFEEYGLIIGNSYELNPTVTVEGAKYLLDIDQDGDVDKDDALILLQVVNGTTTNDYVAANEVTFDLNENGALDTTDVHMLLKAIADGNMEEVLVVEDELDVTVNIQLSAEDKAYLDGTFANGMFVDGFIQLDGNVDLTVPFLAFYGNWADPNMFEHVNYLDLNEYSYSYSDTYETNAFVDSYGYVVGGNNYAEEDAYLPERNAISSENGDVAGAFYTLIRNSAATKVIVTDQETNEVYFTKDLGPQESEYYYVNGQTWENTQLEAIIGWDVTDANGEPLAEGTKVNVSIVALPEYYADATDIPGKGSAFTLPLTVDNTAPEVTDVVKNEDGTINVTFKDNQYVAAVQIYDRDEQIIDQFAANQTEANTEMTQTIAVDKEVVDSKVLFITVVDYAGNVKTVRANLTGLEDATYATGIEIRKDGRKVETVNAFVGKQTQLYAYVFPETLENTEATWASDNEDVAVVRDGVVYGVSRGTATITATSVATDAEGNPFTAECKVTVIDNNFVAIRDDWTQEFSMNWNHFYAGSMADGEDVLGINYPYISATDYGPYLITCDKNGYYFMNNNTRPFASNLLNAPLYDMTWGQATGYLTGVYGPYVIWTDVNGQANPKIFDFSTYIGGAYVNGITYVGWQYDNPASPSDIFEYYAVSTTHGEIYYLSFSYINDSPWAYELVATGTGLESDIISHNSLAYDPDNGLIYWATAYYEEYPYAGQVYELYCTDMYMYDEVNETFAYLSSSDLYQMYYGLVNPELFGLADADATSVENSRVDINNFADITLGQQLSKDTTGMIRLPENVLTDEIEEFDGHVIDPANINVYEGGNN